MGFLIGILCWFTVSCEIGFEAVELHRPVLLATFAELAIHGTESASKIRRDTFIAPFEYGRYIKLSLFGCKVLAEERMEDEKIRGKRQKDQLRR